jgi:hypothetical protein
MPRMLIFINIFLFNINRYFRQLWKLISDMRRALVKGPV